MDDRFVELYRQAGLFQFIEMKIVLDRVTGVQYLLAYNGNQVASITPLLDSTGKPVIADGPGEYEG